MVALTVSALAFRSSSVVSLSALVGEFQRRMRAQGREQALAPQAPALPAPTYGTLLHCLEDPQLEKRFYGGMAGLDSDVQESVEREGGAVLIGLGSFVRLHLVLRAHETPPGGWEPSIALDPHSDQRSLGALFHRDGCSPCCGAPSTSYLRRGF